MVEPLGMRAMLIFGAVLAIQPGALGAGALARDKRGDDNAYTTDMLHAMILQQAKLMEQQSAQIQALQTRVSDQQAELKRSRTQVAFTAYFAAGGTILDVGHLSPIRFNRVSINSGNGYNPTTGIFTAPASGIYLFYLHIRNDHTKEDIDVAITKGSQDVMMTNLNANIAFGDASAAVTLHVAAGETVFCRQSAHGSSIEGWFDTQFTGVLLFAD